MQAYRPLIKVLCLALCITALSACTNSTAPNPAKQTTDITETGSSIDTESPTDTEPITEDSQPHMHTETPLPAVEPTFEAEGKTAGSYCTDCGAPLIAQSAVPSYKAQAETLFVGTSWTWAEEHYWDEYDEWSGDWGDLAFRADGSYSSYRMGGYRVPEEGDAEINGHFYVGAMGAASTDGTYEITDFDGRTVTFTIHVTEFEEWEEQEPYSYTKRFEIIDGDTIRELYDIDPSYTSGALPSDGIFHRDVS